jgi:thymidylate kinase
VGAAALAGSLLCDLADALEARADEAIVGVEGPAYAGKSTYCRRLAESMDAEVLPELTRSPRMRAMIAAPWPNVEAEQVRRQLAVLEEEGARVDRVRAAGLHGRRVLDRTLLSPVAYLYARVEAGHASPASLAAVIAGARRLVEAGRALVPARVVYLSVDPAECRRRSRETVERPARGTEPFLLMPRTIDCQRRFMEALAPMVSRIALDFEPG